MFEKIRKGTNGQQRRLKWPYKLKNLKHINHHPLAVIDMVNVI
jgi:hypothetical protein